MGAIEARQAVERRTAASTPVDRWLLGRIRALVPSAAIGFQLWDGFTLQPVRAPVGTIRFRRRAALLAWAWDPELNVGETYMSGDVEIDGDLLAVLEEIYRTFGAPRRRLSLRWARANDARAAQENVHRHYDLGNQFYRLWLDREMVYTCAYYPTPDATLEDAQIAKMDLICRKLRLSPGDRVVEAGCGWGALALFMARRYGARVRAFNVSTEQIAFARDRALAEGLTGRVEFVEDDYRTIKGQYDVFVSVGMLEHVGPSDYPTFGRIVAGCLTPSGRGLLHFIGRNQPGPLNPWIRKRIFPGAYPPTLGEVFEHVLEPHALSVLDVENLRLHYAQTLEHWRSRFDASRARVSDLFDDRFVRAWRLYLAGSEAAFTTGWMQLFQVLFARGGTNDIPWTRATS